MTNESGQFSFGGFKFNKSFLAPDGQFQDQLPIIKRVCNHFRIIQEIKPKHHKPNQADLIKETQPFQWVSIDLKILLLIIQVSVNSY